MIEEEKPKRGCTITFAPFNTVGLVFLVLKLLNIEPVAHWSWIWVLCPFWIGFAFLIGFVLLGIILMGIGYVLGESLRIGKK